MSTVLIKKKLKKNSLSGKVCILHILMQTTVFHAQNLVI